MESSIETALSAAEANRAAEALLVTAGAGMGVDSGLPDFRGDEGFWRAYQPFRERGLRFVELANPRWFSKDPALAWGFYGHRLNLYRATMPHAGFGILKRWSERMPSGSFVFTSNVDGQFQKAGFDGGRVVECHGSIHHLQSVTPGDPPGIWPADEAFVAVDEATFRAAPPLPTCPGTDRPARPNVLMFGDRAWEPSRTSEQEGRYAAWLRSVRGKRLVVIECGAGTAVPTVRYESERVGGALVRINLREPEVPRRGVSVPMGAAEALRRIDAVLPKFRG